jgi:hypothetical protein
MSEGESCYYARAKKLDFCRIQKKKKEERKRESRKKNLIIILHYRKTLFNFYPVFLVKDGDSKDGYLVRFFSSVSPDPPTSSPHYFDGTRKRLMRDGDENRLYTASTPNGQKISITLEELGLTYETVHIDIAKGVQKEDWFLRINRVSPRAFSYLPTIPSCDSGLSLIHIYT